jgi:hypothetical protein
MKIELKGELISELTSLGIKSGDVVEATPDRMGKTGAMYFEKHYYGSRYDCVVWPDNYDVITK